MRVVSCQRLLYLAETCHCVWSDVSSFASKSLSDIIRTRLETCSAHIRSPSLTGSVTHSSQPAGKKKEGKIGIRWNFQLPETDFYVTTKVFILSNSRHHLNNNCASQKTRIFPQSPRREKCNSCTEKASIFCNKKCHLEVHRNLLELVQQAGQGKILSQLSTFVIKINQIEVVRGNLNQIFRLQIKDQFLSGTESPE